MRPALHSSNLHEDVPVYASLSHEIGSSAPAYPTFPASLHHVNTSHDHNISSYGVPSGAEHQAPSSHAEHIEHNGMHLDPNLSPEGTSIGRHFATNSREVQQHHDFPQPLSDSMKGAPMPNPPSPPIILNSAPPGHFDMLPPPASTHSSWQSLHEYAQSHASEHGYALSINTTAKNRSRIKLACVCYGAPKNTHKLTPETRVRKNRVSYKTGCKMWIEGRKQDDGLWALRVGEPLHNHPGRAVEGWAVQRKRTWGVPGGRVGVGGVTAKEEKEKMGSVENGQSANQDAGVIQEHVRSPAQVRKPSHSLESGGLVWKIVEQEMLRKAGPGQGRDRGVGRTVKILEERLPGIHIFKRDVYNIRAHIKRARKAAGQQLGDGIDNSDNEEAIPEAHDVDAPHVGHEDNSEIAGDGRGFSQIDPTLIAQCNSALRNIPPQMETEVERLRRELAEVSQALSQRTKELEEKNSENESLRVQVELANMALYNERGGPPQ